MELNMETVKITSRRRVQALGAERAESVTTLLISLRQLRLSSNAPVSDHRNREGLDTVGPSTSDPSASHGHTSSVVSGTRGGNDQFCALLEKAARMPPGAPRDPRQQPSQAFLRCVTHSALNNSTDSRRVRATGPRAWAPYPISVMIAARAGVHICYETKRRFVHLTRTWWTLVEEGNQSVIHVWRTQRQLRLRGGQPTEQIPGDLFEGSKGHGMPCSHRRKCIRRSGRRIGDLSIEEGSWRRVM